MKLHILTFILVFLLSGCSIMEDYDNSCPETDDAEYISLTFKMMTSFNGSSRTDVTPGHTEDISEWSEFEDRIDTDDFAFFIYAENGDNKENWPLIVKVTDFNLDTDNRTVISGESGAYTVSIQIEKSELTNYRRFRLIALANLNTNSEQPDIADEMGLSTQAESDGDAGSGESEEYNIYNNLRDANYKSFIESAEDLKYNLVTSLYPVPDIGDMDSSDDPGSSDSEPELSTEENLLNSAIPMFGMMGFNIRDEVFNTSRPDEPIFIDNLYMMRSLAKIRVIDRINKTDGYPRIESIILSSAITDAYIVPELTGYSNGSQVETARPCEDNAGEMGKVSYDGRDIGLGGGLSPIGSAFSLVQNGDVFFGYLPEQDINSGIPVRLSIDVRFQEDDDVFTYDVPLSGYEEQDFDFGESFLRNHIYTLEVIQLREGEAEFKVKVEEWTPEVLTLDYSEIGSYSISWTTESYESKASNTYILKPWNNASYVPLEGTLTFSTPVGAQWLATLLNTGYNPDAIVFVDDQFGFTSTVASGIIGDTQEEKKFKIKIIGEQNPTRQNSAKLRIAVRLSNGTVYTLDDKEINIIIVQNPL